MTLSKHIDSEKLIHESRDHPIIGLVERDGEDRRKYHTNPKLGKYSSRPLPKYEIPEEGIQDDIAYQIIHDDLESDSRPCLNLASFVHTQQPEPANKLILENVNKNFADQDQYPASKELHDRCVSIIANLWGVPSGSNAVGTATGGSSEALMLAGLAMKKRWQAKRKEQGKSFKEPGPNVIFGAHAHCCVEKFARYFDVEARIIPISKETNYTSNFDQALSMVDENTIGFITILGSTYTGHFENIEKLSKLLDDLQARTGFDIPIHIDGASGGFIAPFSFPHLKWGFDIPRVVSINASAHKYGATYVGIGFVLWRDQKYLPHELIFEMHYLGSTEFSFTLNFSKSATPIIATYYNFINLGFNGYKNVQIDDFSKARMLARALEKSGYFEVLSDVHRPRNDNDRITNDETSPEFYKPCLPVVAFKWTDEFIKQHPHLQQKWLQILLRTKGWIVPNYALAKNLEQIEILRVVIREELSEDMIDQLVKDIIEIHESLADTNSDFYKLAVISDKDDQTKSGAHQGYSRPC